MVGVVLPLASQELPRSLPHKACIMLFCPLLYYSFLPGVVGKTLCATKTSKGVLYIWRRECLKSCTLYFSARCCIILFCLLLYHIFLPAAVSYLSARCRVILFSPLLRHTCLPAIVSCFSACCCIIPFCPVLYHTFLPAIVSYFSGRYF